MKKTEQLVLVSWFTRLAVVLRRRKKTGNKVFRVVFGVSGKIVKATF